MKILRGIISGLFLASLIIPILFCDYEWVSFGGFKGAFWIKPRTKMMCCSMAFIVSQKHHGTGVYLYFPGNYRYVQLLKDPSEVSCTKGCKI